MEKYELYFIAHPELTSEEVEDLVKSISTMVETELEAKNVSVNNQGLKKLAYPIKKHRTGTYVLVQFDCEDRPTTSTVEKKLNVHDSILRYLLLNQTDYYAQKEKELKVETETTNHRDLNRGKQKKVCVVNHLGLRAIDYKDTEFLSQFTSPYAKIFARDKTGNSAKNQRKITTAIKRARHMALMPFTPIHFE